MPVDIKSAYLTKGRGYTPKKEEGATMYFSWCFLIFWGAKMGGGYAPVAPPPLPPCLRFRYFAKLIIYVNKLSTFFIS